jgi:hypothetical protein
LKSHGFGAKLGFVDAPPVLDSWRIDTSDLAVCSLEQFYASDAYKKLAINFSS